MRSELRFSAWIMRRTAFLFLLMLVLAAPAMAGESYDVSPGSFLVEKNGVPILGSPFANDTAAIQAAIDAASDGDTVHLRAGTFVLGEPKTETLEPLVYPGGPIAPNERLGLNIGAPVTSNASNQLIRVDRAVTMLGDVDAEGFPSTVVATAVPFDPVTSTGDESRFLCWSNERGRAPTVFRNLRFQDMALSITSTYPLKIDNVRINTHVLFGMAVVVDLRSSYPAWSPGNDDRSDPIFTEIEDSSIAGRQPLVTISSAVQLKSTDFTDGTTILLAALDLSYSGPYANARWIEDILIEDCVFGSSDFDGLWLASYNSGGPSVIRSAQIRDNVFEDIADHAILLDARRFSQIMNVEIHGNEFRRSGIGISTLGRSTHGSVMNAVIGGNTFDDMWGTQPGFFPVNVCLFLFGVMDSSIIKNDYTNSGQPSLSDSSTIADSTILLYPNTARNTIFESGGFPEGQGGATNHLTDLGSDNRVVGESANTVERPAGIGDSIREARESTVSTTRSLEID